MTSRIANLSNFLGNRLSTGQNAFIMQDKKLIKKENNEEGNEEKNENLAQEKKDFLQKEIQIITDKNKFEEDKQYYEDEDESDEYEEENNEGIPSKITRSQFKKFYIK